MTLNFELDSTHRIYTLYYSSHFTLFLFRFIFFFTDPATTEIYTLSLHDALPISSGYFLANLQDANAEPLKELNEQRSEEHTSELQSRRDLVCRLLLEKKKMTQSDLTTKHTKYK